MGRLRVSRRASGLRERATETRSGPIRSAQSPDRTVVSKLEQRVVFRLFFGWRVAGSGQRRLARRVSYQSLNLASVQDISVFGSHRLVFGLGLLNGWLSPGMAPVLARVAAWDCVFCPGNDRRDLGRDGISSRRARKSAVGGGPAEFQQS